MFTENVRGSGTDVSEKKDKGLGLKNIMFSESYLYFLKYAYLERNSQVFFPDYKRTSLKTDDTIIQNVLNLVYYWGVLLQWKLSIK